MGGAFTVTIFDSTINNIAGGSLKGYRSDMDAGRVVSVSNETRPANVSQPVIVYLGTHA